MADLDKLRRDYEAAEQRLQKLGAEYDDAKQKLRSRYQDRLAKASADAATAQKAACDAEALEALMDRPDGEAVARSLVAQGAFDKQLVNQSFAA